jgi:hypothetical protein
MQMRVTAILLVVSSTSAGCGDDDGSGTDGGVRVDSGRVPDASRPRDSGAPRDGGGDDSSVPDAGGVDGGFDAGGIDGGSDAGLPDAGFDGGPPPDAGEPPDAGDVMYTFASPLQVDLSSIFTVNTVASSAPTGGSFPPLSSMDGSGYVYFTRNFGSTAGDAAGGMPDDGLFAATLEHPTIQLAFSDSSVADNSIILNAPGGPTSTTFPVVATSFATVQLYFTSTEGSAATEVTLTYTDGTTSRTTFTVPDWFTPGAAAAPVFVVASGFSRYSGDFDFSHGASFYGATIAADPAKTLTSVTLAVTSGGRLAFYGATAYR